jgi:hypothetical protein
MKKLALLLALTVSTVAHAGGKTYYVLPPEHYDYPYPGALTIIRASSEQEVRDLCPTAKFGSIGALACRKGWDNYSCTLVIATDDVIESWGFPPELVLRHELAHCNGWGQNHWGVRAWQKGDAPTRGDELPAEVKNWLSNPKIWEEAIDAAQRPPVPTEANPKSASERATSPCGLAIQKPCDAIPSARNRSLNEILFGR